MKTGQSEMPLSFFCNPPNATDPIMTENSQPTMSMLTCYTTKLFARFDLPSFADHPSVHYTPLDMSDLNVKDDKWFNHDMHANQVSKWLLQQTESVKHPLRGHLGKWFKHLMRVESRQIQQSLHQMIWFVDTATSMLCRLNFPQHSRQGPKRQHADCAQYNGATAHGLLTINGIAC
eukprot:scaffold748_cov176-Ochromonas_danica.AAC.16